MQINWFLLKTHESFFSISTNCSYLETTFWKSYITIWYVNKLFTKQLLTYSNWVLLCKIEGQRNIRSRNLQCSQSIEISKNFWSQDGQRVAMQISEKESKQPQMAHTEFYSHVRNKKEERKMFIIMVRCLNTIEHDDFRCMKFIYLYCSEEIKLRDPRS